MKKLLASMAMLAALSACSQEAEAPAAPVEEVAATPAVTMQTYVGTWNVAMADGTSHVTTNNPDGTFSSVYSDGSADGGSWTFTLEQSCWTADGAEAVCYTMSEADAAGTITLTNVADGSVITATPVVAEAAAE